MFDAEISRVNPTCIIFLIDQSASMQGALAGEEGGKRKCDAVADIINKMLQTLCIKCSKADGLREYFEIGVIGYGKGAASILGGTLAGRKLVRIGEIAVNPVRVESRQKLMDDGAGGVFKQTLMFPVWFESVASGKTPMRQALELTREWLAEFLGRHPGCFPPMVFNITDGAPDDDPKPAAESVRRLESKDGNVLLFNLHISSKPGTPIMFPGSEEGLPNDHLAKQLFQMSSVLPERFVECARAEDLSVSDTSRGFGFHADLGAVFKFINIGTMTSPKG